MAESAFPAAVEFVLHHEGGYVNHPNDPGGETNFGISRRAYPNVDVAGLTPYKAKQIYRLDYWDRLNLDHFPAVVATIVFDTAVNMGRRRAVQFIQQAFNQLPDGGHLAVDGRLGPLTRRAITGWCEAHPAWMMAQELILLRVKRYSVLARQKEKRVFLRGWIARAMALYSLVTKTPNKDGAK